MPDACGGHAAPYHFHTKLACEYQESESAQHSPLVAVMLDGVGLIKFFRAIMARCSLRNKTRTQEAKNGKTASKHVFMRCIEIGA